MVDWIFFCTLLVMVLGHWLVDILPEKSPDAWHRELCLEPLYRTRETNLR